MTKSNIQIYLYTSLIIALIVGVYVFIWWYKKVSKRLNKSVEKSKTIESIGMKSLFYNSPSIIAFFLLCIPSLYFGHLLKQHTFCKDIVRINSKSGKGFDFKNEEFLEDCGCFDINELTKKI